MKSVSADAKAACAAGLALLGIYIATLAPGVTLWDSGEFLAAIHSLGIPHPPGTPLYVIVANVWARAFGPLVGFAKSVNVFSAVCAASGCAVLANLFSRWAGDRYTGVAAAICAGATSSLWLSATETEVYAPAFLAAMVLLWIANECAEQRNARYLVLLGYVAGLGWSLHLTALIAFPAALMLSAEVVIAARRRDRLRILAGAAIAGVLGASAVLFMYLRAQHDPAINQGNPGSFTGIVDVISRRQYGSVGLFARQAPLYLQIGNMFEWADWQFALGLDPRQPPGWLRTPVTVLFGLLGAFGFATHRNLHRPSWRAMALLFATASAGVVLYLNLKAGPSYGVGLLKAGALHEARERDYFFILAWVCWGAWSGVGAIAGARKLARPVFAIPLGLAVASSPVVMNWRAVDRSHEPAASGAASLAKGILRQAPARAVVLANADNDTYPVWYAREVEGVRADVVTITIPLLAAKWYREEIARRHQMLDRRTVDSWKGTEATLRVICRSAALQSRPIVGPFDRTTGLLPSSCLGFGNEQESLTHAAQLLILVHERLSISRRIPLFRSGVH